MKHESGSMKFRFSHFQFAVFGTNRNLAAATLKTKN